MCADLSGTDPAGNLQTVRDYTHRAADAGARLVVFPEGTMCRFGVPLAPGAEPIDGRWADAVRAIADACPGLSADQIGALFGGLKGETIRDMLRGTE